MKSERPIINSNHDCDVSADRSQWEPEIIALTFGKGWERSAVVPPTVDFVQWAAGGGGGHRHGSSPKFGWETRRFLISCAGQSILSEVGFFCCATEPGGTVSGGNAAKREMFEWTISPQATPTTTSCCYETSDVFTLLWSLIFILTVGKVPPELTPPLFFAMLTYNINIFLSIHMSHLNIVFLNNLKL